MTGIFRRPHRRPPLRRVVITGPAVVQAPGLHRRAHPSVARMVAARVARHVRRVAPLPLLGVRAPGAPVIPIAKMLMERHRKIMRERLAREQRPVEVPLPQPAAVGLTPFALRPIITAVDAAVAIRRGAAVAVGGARRSVAPARGAPAAQRPARAKPPRRAVVAVTGIRQPGVQPARPLRGPTPAVAAAFLRRVAKVALGGPFVPGVMAPVSRPRPARRPPRMPRVAARMAPGGPFVPGAVPGATRQRAARRLDVRARGAIRAIVGGQAAAVANLVTPRAMLPRAREARIRAAVRAVVHGFAPIAPEVTFHPRRPRPQPAARHAVAHRFAPGAPPTPPVPTHAFVPRAPRIFVRVIPHRVVRTRIPLGLFILVVLISRDLEVKSTSGDLEVKSTSEDLEVDGTGGDLTI